MELQPDELAALIRYHAGRMNVNGHLMPDAAKRIIEISAAIQDFGLTQAQINARKDTR
jgi:hypothetical protein